MGNPMDELNRLSQLFNKSHERLENAAEAEKRVMSEIKYWKDKRMIDSNQIEMLEMRVSALFSEFHRDQKLRIKRQVQDELKRANESVNM